MSCFLVRNIKHGCDYNSGGIQQIFLLDIEDFKTYVFQEDGLYDSCFVERIRIKRTGYVELDILSESNFTETQDNGIFKQQLTTVIRSLQAEKTNSLLIASKRKYLVIFSSYSGRMFSFGSDGGAVVSFSQTSGTLGESEVYSLSIDKNSIYPLFEIDKNAMKVYLLGTEDKSNFITSEDLTNLFEIDGYEHK